MLFTIRPIWHGCAAVWKRNREGQLQDIERHKLNAMGAFAEAQTCRRLVLLNYFGEGRQEACGNCDICPDPPKQYDGLMDARKGTLDHLPRKPALPGWATWWRCCAVPTTSVSAIWATTNCLSTVLADQSHEHWVSIIRQLIHLGFATQNIASTPPCS